MEPKMLTYDDAKGMLKGARNGRRKLGNNTYLETRRAGEQWAGAAYANGDKDAPHYAVRLHHTDVVTLHPDGSQTLNSGGWRTVTTKDRINAYSFARVFSDRGSWRACILVRPVW